MIPDISIKYYAVAAATLAQFFIGFVWYTLIFGKRWAREVGIPMEGAPEKREMVRGMLLSLLGALLTSYVLAHGVNVWRASVWGAGEDSPFYVYGFFGALFVWLGYFVPQTLDMVAWQRKSWTAFFITSSGHLVSLLAAAMIVAGWR